MVSRFGDDFGGRWGGGERRLRQGPMAQETLGFVGDTGHHAHGLQRILAAGGFRGEHHRVGAVEDRVGDVVHFGAGGRGFQDHGFEHLRRRDHEFSPKTGVLDDGLLRAGNAGQSQLHPQIAARHHDSVGGVDDVVQIIQRLRLLAFGDDG